MSIGARKAATAAFLAIVVLTTTVARAEQIASSTEARVVTRALRLSEFSFAVKEAKKLGVRLWLHGGGVAALVHYELESQRGAFSVDRYPDLFEAVFRSDQDIDFLIDGTAAQATKLKTILAAKYPRSIGHRSTWGVDVLTFENGKVRIGKFSDVTGQHSDGHSRAVLELTTPPRNERCVRDLDRWEAEDSRFLDDASAGIIRFLPSARHPSPAPGVEFRNPPILSVMRTVEKAVRYGLTIPDESLAEMQRHADQFSPQEAPSGGYVFNWLRWHGTRMLRHARNVEAAFALLDKLGLREKLRQMGNATDTDSLAYWFGREPLPTKPIGEGNGATAASLGISRVSHETRSALSLESLTANRDGSIYPFASRNGAPGERASFGQGFYTRPGETSYYHGNFLVLMDLHPDAREGHDFQRVGSDYILVLNRAAVTVVNGPWTTGFIEGLERYGERDSMPGEDFFLSEVWLHRFEAHVPAMNAAEKAAFDEALQRELELTHPSSPLLGVYFRTAPIHTGKALLRHVALHADGARLLAEAVLPYKRWWATTQALLDRNTQIANAVSLAYAAQKKREITDPDKLIRELDALYPYVTSAQGFAFLTDATLVKDGTAQANLDYRVSDWLSRFSELRPLLPTIRRMKRQIAYVETLMVLMRAVVKGSTTAEQLVEALDPLTHQVSKPYLEELEKLYLEVAPTLANRRVSAEQIRRIALFFSNNGAIAFLDAAADSCTAQELYDLILAVAPGAKRSNHDFVQHMIQRFLSKFAVRSPSEDLIFQIRALFPGYLSTNGQNWVTAFLDKIPEARRLEFIGVSVADVASWRYGYLHHFATTPAVSRQYPPDHPVLWELFRNAPHSHFPIQFSRHRLADADTAPAFVAELPLLEHALTMEPIHLDFLLRVQLERFASRRPWPDELATVFRYFRTPETYAQALRLFVDENASVELLRATLTAPPHLSPAEAVSTAQAFLKDRWPNGVTPRGTRTFLRSWRAEAKRTLRRLSEPKGCADEVAEAENAKTAA